MTFVLGQRTYTPANTIVAYNAVPEYCSSNPSSSDRIANATAKTTPAATNAISRTFMQNLISDAAHGCGRSSREDIPVRASQASFRHPA